ncbi:MAG: hypothetical protein WA210_16370 [Burkholderiaceae bacterium]
MALNPVDEAHALQIQAGVLGRHAGHEFEDRIAMRINKARYPIDVPTQVLPNVAVGEPADLLLKQVGIHRSLRTICAARAISTGALATSSEGKRWLSINGVSVSRCKSDLVLNLRSPNSVVATVGVSTKQCNNASPTNAQLYFTTANGFANLLRRNGLQVSELAVHTLRSFCGEPGHRPIDSPVAMVGRLVDPRRYFWEELDPQGRAELEALLSTHQDAITTLLLQKAYLDDPFTPDFLLHKTKRSQVSDQTEVAIYPIDNLVSLSGRYQRFVTRPYSVRKGSYKDPPGITHLAPRFGIVQMQRGGQKQHPEQLQFNLEAGYFYRL